MELLIEQVNADSDVVAQGLLVEVMAGDGISAQERADIDAANDHRISSSNPHNVTASQAAAEPVGAVAAHNGAVQHGTTVQEQERIVANTAKETNIGHPLVETAVPFGAVFTDNDTVYDDTDVVKAPLGVLPILDGSNLTGLPTSSGGGGFTYTASTNPLITTNPAEPNATWFNDVSGEIFGCTDNTVDENTWIGQLGTVVEDAQTQTPTLIAPADGTTDVVETPTLTADTFACVGGTDTHATSSWQVASDSGFSAIVYESLADASNLESIAIPGSNLQVGTQYYWRVKYTGTTYGDGGYSTTFSFTTKSAFAIPYGLTWHNTSDTYTRTGDANYTQVQSLMKRCVLNANGTVNYYLDPTDSNKKADGVTASVLDGSDGNVMVEIPKFYAKYDNTTAAKNMSVCLGPQAGYVVHPAFIKNGVEVAFRYIRAYKGSFDGTKLISRSGVRAGASETIVQFRTRARDNGAGWELTDWNLLFAVQTLLFIEIGTFRSQSVLGNGNMSGSTYGMTTGSSNSIGNASTTFTDPGGDTWMSYRGIENFYADIFEWIDGINVSELNVYVNNKHTTFASDVFSGDYVDTGVNLPASGYIKDMDFSLNGFIPTVSGGSDSTYVPDYMPSTSGARVVAFGGYAGRGLICGAATLRANYDSSYTSASIGGGLSY